MSVARCSHGIRAILAFFSLGFYPSDGVRPVSAPGPRPHHGTDDRQDEYLVVRKVVRSGLKYIGKGRWADAAGPQIHDLYCEEGDRALREAEPAFLVGTTGPVRWLPRVRGDPLVGAEQQLFEGPLRGTQNERETWFAALLLSDEVLAWLNYADGSVQAGDLWSIVRREADLVLPINRSTYKDDHRYFDQMKTYGQTRGSEGTLSYVAFGPAAARKPYGRFGLGVLRPAEEHEKSANLSKALVQAGTRPELLAQRVANESSTFLSSNEPRGGEQEEAPYYYSGGDSDHRNILSNFENDLANPGGHISAVTHISQYGGMRELLLAPARLRIWLESFRKKNSNIWSAIGHALEQAVQGKGTLADMHKRRAPTEEKVIKVLAGHFLHEQDALFAAVEVPWRDRKSASTRKQRLSNWHTDNFTSFLHMAVTLQGERTLGLELSGVPSFGSEAGGEVAGRTISAAEEDDDGKKDYVAAEDLYVIRNRPGTVYIGNPAAYRHAVFDHDTEQRNLSFQLRLGFPWKQLDTGGAASWGESLGFSRHDLARERNKGRIYAKVSKTIARAMRTELARQGGFKSPTMADLAHESSIFSTVEAGRFAAQSQSHGI